MNHINHGQPLLALYVTQPMAKGTDALFNLRESPPSWESPPKGMRTPQWRVPCPAALVISLVSRARLGGWVVKLIWVRKRPCGYGMNISIPAQHVNTNINTIFLHKCGLTPPRNIEKSCVTIPVKTISGLLSANCWNCARGLLEAGAHRNIPQSPHSCFLPQLAPAIFCINNTLPDRPRPQTLI